METWEYTVKTEDTSNIGQLEKQLNQVGNQGWELVTCLPHSTDAQLFQMIFKRRVRG